jgi:antitoxin component of RelBE/YafQ-DinJ toxin-antitoxin module
VYTAHKLGAIGAFQQTPDCTLRESGAMPRRYEAIGAFAKPSRLSFDAGEAPRPWESSIIPRGFPMERHEKVIHLRASEQEHARAKELAEELDITISDLVRILLQLPVEDIAAKRAVVLDFVTANRLYRELNHWGYQRNQAVHAFNRIAYYLERNSMDADDVIDALSRAKAALDAVNRATAPLASDVRNVAESRILFR